MIETVDLPFLIPDKEIIRGKIFRTVFPYLEERPLQFFEACDDCINCSNAAKGHDYCGRVTQKAYGFDERDDATLYVVNRFKARYAIVLSTHILNENERWHTVIVAPIIGIHNDELDKLRIKKIMNRDPSYFIAYYLEPSFTGMHAYIDLGRISPIQKNWLLQEKAFISDDKMFDEISERIGLTLSQKKLAQCNNCKRPCEKCDLKEEIETLKKQLALKGA